MSLLVRAFPLQAPVEKLRAFTAAMEKRAAEVERFYDHFGVTHESWYLQQTPTGPWVIGLTQVEEVRESVSRFQVTQEGFAAWFKQQIRDLSGVDPDQQPLGPPTELVWEWSDTDETAQAFCAPPPM